MAKRKLSAVSDSSSGIDDEQVSSSRYAITFGEVALLHVGGAEFGSGRREHGFTVSELRNLANALQQSELILLSDALPKSEQQAHEAAVLVLRDGAQTLLGLPNAADLLWREQTNTKYDQKFFDRGRTKNKIARHNIVFGEVEQGASEDYKECTIRAFKNLPWLANFRKELQSKLGAKASGLNAEGNHYYNPKCGIGYHGDSERKIVIGLSLGAAAILRYRWRKPHSSEPVGSSVDINLQHGDVYVMSEKATGFDWKSRSKWRVVHAAGAPKYID